MSADDTNDTPEAADHDANKIGDVNEVDDSVNEIDNDLHDGAVTGGVYNPPLVPQNVIGGTSGQDLTNGSVGADIIYETQGNDVLASNGVTLIGIDPSNLAATNFEFI